MILLSLIGCVTLEKTKEGVRVTSTTAKKDDRVQASSLATEKEDRRETGSPATEKRDEVEVVSTSAGKRDGMELGSPLPEKTKGVSEASEYLMRSKTLLSQGDYEGALKENQKVLSLSGNETPGDEALFNIALIYTHPGNPKKDYGKSLGFFKKLAKDYPQSPWSPQAKAWTAVLQENEKLRSSVEELNQVIEKSKQVDIEIDEKRREKAK
jgi:tetratricopeptide (TPR) repeat protein